MKIEKNANLARYASFRTGGSADTLVTPANIFELTAALKEYGCCRFLRSVPGLPFR